MLCYAISIKLNSKFVINYFNLRLGKIFLRNIVVLLLIKRLVQRFINLIKLTIK